ncbi:MAG: DUF2497 domain-containing protein [Rhodomicrobium sp.]
MNRADQAPEPSMEELLASIRLIISDADSKKGPPQNEAHYSRALASAAVASAGASDAAAGDDVFDLTDELVFPEQRAAPLASSPTERRGQPKIAERPEPEGYHAYSRGAPAGPSAFPPPPLGPAVQRRPETNQAPKPDGQQYAQPPAHRPVWSRRELPSPAASQAPAPKPRQDSMAARPQARNWAADIQMPVPDRGPVSLISTAPAKPAAAIAAAEDSANGTENAGHEPRVSSGNVRGKEEAAAVAALAERLARSAMGAMEENELETAQQVDFEHLDADSRAEVSEKFADVMERESAAHGTHPLPSLLDEVFRQDFIRDETDGGQSGEEAVFVAFEETFEPETLTRIEQPAVQDLQAAAAAQPDYSPEPVQSQIPVQATPPVAPQLPAGPQAAAPAQPLAQAQYMGPAQSAIPAQASRTLEDAVREMLRPLLVQWLNDNMPRILENAIREEIAMRGILPKSGD